MESIKVNFVVLALAALIPLVVGMIWYNKKVMGTAWIKSTGFTEDQLKGGNMALTFILTYVFSFLVSFALLTITIHQFSVMSVLANDPSLMDPNSELGKMFEEFMSKYGRNFRTFKHGALHGTIAGLFIGLPIIGINAMFERRGAKYIFINAAYWVICMALMGGVICGYN